MMRSVYTRMILMCCVLFYLSFATHVGSEVVKNLPPVSEEQPPEAVADASVSAQEGVEPADSGYGSVDLSELPAEGKQYLGLTDDVKPILKNVDADLIIVEFMSVYCSSCQTQTPIFNQLYPRLQSGVKMMGIGVGNNKKEVGRFREEREVAFPILPDPKFKVYERLINSMRSPYTVMLRRSKDGNLVPVDSHLGLIRSYESYLGKIKMAMEYTEDMLKEAEKRTGKVAEKAELRLSGEELMAKVRESMIRASGDQNMDVTPDPIPIRVTPEMPETPEVYEGKSGNVRYFAVIANEESICDICHDIQFIYVFDEKGDIVDFEPIQLTKYGDYKNKEWNEKDIEKTRQRIVGRSVLQPVNFDFDPEVDAVTSATITSAVIFQALSKSREIFRLVVE